MNRRIIVGLCFLVAAFAAVTSAAAAEKPPPSEYVALGDSFSSGLGAGPPYEPPGPPYPPGACYKQNTSSWPALVAKKLRYAPFVFSACAGAVLASFYEGETQLNAVGANTKLVTFTIGGNNAGFAAIVEKCLNVSEAECKAFGQATIANGEAELAKGAEVAADAELEWPPRNGQGLEWVLAEVRKRAPKAAIRVVLYPELFTPPGAGKSCEIGQATVFGQKLPLTLSEPVIKAFNGWTQTFDNKIAEITTQWQGSEPYWVQVVNTSSAFAKKNICTTKHEDMNLVTTVGTTPEPQSLHPTADGYKAIAKLVEESLTL